MSIINPSIVDVARFGVTIFQSATIPLGVTNIFPVPGGASNGLIIRWVSGFAAAAASVHLYCDLAPPASAADLTRRRIWSHDLQTFRQDFINMRTPPGMGLWVATTAINCGLTMNYDVL